MKRCRLCPRNCGADRAGGRTGACGVPALVYVARAALHFWEEPCISGTRGSGAVFFSGCALGCVYCQNGPISGTAGKYFSKKETVEIDGAGIQPRKAGRDSDRPGSSYGMEGGSNHGFGAPPNGRILGKAVTVDKLAQIFLRLQNEQGANNINLVTAGHYLPQVAEALRLAREQGLLIPVVYNSSGYEKVSSLRLLEGLVDVWLPDFKYMDPEIAGLYSHAQDYPEVAKEAIAEMVRQAPEPEFYEKDGQALIRRGVIVRHLLLPGHVGNAREVVRYLHETYGDSVYISLMNQYTPVGNLPDPSHSEKVHLAQQEQQGQQMRQGRQDRQTSQAQQAQEGQQVQQKQPMRPRRELQDLQGSDLRMRRPTYREMDWKSRQLGLLERRVTRREYRRLVDDAVEMGVERGFLQEGETAKESFIPSWNGEGV